VRSAGARAASTRDASIGGRGLESLSCGGPPCILSLEDKITFRQEREWMQCTGLVLTDCTPVREWGVRLVVLTDECGGEGCGVGRPSGSLFPLPSFS